MELFTLLGSIKIDDTKALESIRKVKTEAQNLAKFISTDSSASGDIKVTNTLAMSAINEVRMAIKQLKADLSSISGDVNVNNALALSVLDAVRLAAKQLAADIGTATGHVSVDNTTALSLIDGVKSKADEVAGYITSNPAATGKINVSNSTAISNIAAVTSAINQLVALAATPITINLTAGQTTPAGYLGANGTYYLNDEEAVIGPDGTVIYTGQTGANGTSGNSGTNGTSGTTGSTDTGTQTGTGGNGMFSGLWGGLTTYAATIGNKASNFLNRAGNMLLYTSIYKGINAMKNYFHTGFEHNQNMEKWTSMLKTYLGNDMDKANELMGELWGFAVDTPLSMAEVIDQSVKLLATGTAPENLIDTLGVIGDISQGDTAMFSKVSRAYWQIMTTGRLLSQDANQLTQAGVPIWQIMTDYFNTIGRDGDTEWTVTKARGLATAAALQGNPELAISGEEVAAALKWVTSPGGMYYNAMNNIMNTEYGQAQKMKDSYEIAAGTFTKAFFDVFTSDTIPALNEILQKLNDWAIENPEALENLAEAFSNFATTGLSALLDGLTGIVSFWNENQGVFDKMAQVLGAILLASGHKVAGTALLMAGGIEGLEERKKEFGGLTSDVNLPYIKQQMEYQGLGDQWEAYLESWKQARRDENFSEEDINAFIEKQFAEYIPLPDEQFATDLPWVKKDDEGSTGGEGSTDGEKTWFDYMFPGFSWLLNQNNEDEQNEHNGSPAASLRWLQANMYNQAMLFASASGMPERGGDGFGNYGFYDRSGSLPSVYEGMGGGGIIGLIASVQGLTAAVQSMTGEIPSAISAGIGNISVTGTVTTGNVTLDTGAIVGQLAPRINLALGGLSTLSGRR